MEFTIVQLSKSQAEIHVVIPFSEFEPHVASAARLISEEVEIEGFRRGRAPLEIVKNRVGEMTVYERAADLAVRAFYPDILGRVKNEQELAGISFIPLGNPDIAVTKLAPGNDLEFRARLNRFPDVILPDWRGIAARGRREKREQNVSEEELTQAINWLRESRASLVAVDRPAQAGDRVEVDFTLRQNGILIEGGESKHHPLILGKGKFIPGFEEELVGMKSGDKKSFEIQAPHDWREKQIAGHRIHAEVRMDAVQGRIVPELTDEFARGIGNFSGADALKTSMREGLAQEKEDKERERIRLLMIDSIARGAAIDPPEILIQAELDTMMRELRAGIAQMQMPWQDYLAHIKKSEEDLRHEWREPAEKRVRVSLCLRAIAQAEKIEPTDVEIVERSSRYLEQFGSPEEAAKSIDPEQLKEYTRGIVRNEKVFELLESA